MKRNNHKLLTNGQIIDVESGAISHGAIEITNGMIERIYEEKEASPGHIEQMDLHGKYIIPGLIDMHYHIKEAFSPHFVAAGAPSVRSPAGDTQTLSHLIEQTID